jgi:hypothetical protein
LKTKASTLISTGRAKKAADLVDRSLRTRATEWSAYIQSCVGLLRLLAEPLKHDDITPDEKKEAKSGIIILIMKFCAAL